MKKLMSLLLGIALCTPLFSQKEPIISTNKHEIGVDATPLLQQFLFIGGGYGGTINPYYIMYRFQPNNWALRIGAGGYLMNDERTSNDTIIRESNRTALEFRLGLERKTDFARRWQFFYGFDMKFYRLKHLDKSDFTTNAESYTNDVVENRFGLAPMLGFRFKFNERISITTETNFLFYYYKGYSNRIYTPDGTYNQETDFKGWYTMFTPPTSIFFTYNF